VTTAKRRPIVVADLLERDSRACCLVVLWIILLLSERSVSVTVPRGKATVQGFRSVLAAG
jgi:hypothetical protein